MKNITEYLQINEVSKNLVQRAYNKASGTQKNRIKNLYKKIYGKSVETTIEDIKEQIKINVETNESSYFSEDDVIRAFTE